MVMVHFTYSIDKFPLLRNPLARTAILGLADPSSMPSHPSQVTPSIIFSFAGAMNCSRAVRSAVELIHISKSGGTSMCQLAANAGLWNPGTNINANCLVSPAIAGMSLNYFSTSSSVMIDLFESVTSNLTVIP